MKQQMPDVGKVSPDIFDQIILRQLGRRRREVLVGPQNGVDVGVTDLGHGQVMVTTTDPVFVVPAYGWERSAWFAVHILASDAATSGLAPQYITVDLNLPLSMDRQAFESFWKVFHSECRKIGMAIISGHTGRYEGCNYPMVGGATVICIGPSDRYVTPRMARPGDAVIVTKGAAIEASGLFAVAFPDRIASRYGRAFARRAQDIFWQMSVVDDALTAVQVGVHDGGVTSMHDATECGVWGGLYEVAHASRVGMVIDKGAIILRDDVRKICACFGVDPYSSISEGTLIVTCRPHKAGALIRRLARRHIPATVVGQVVTESRGVVVTDGAHSRPLEHPRVDPFWDAFAKEMANRP